jgi:hypothetical protein
MDADLAADLARRADSAGIRLVLIRRPGRTTSARRRVYLADTMPGRRRLRMADLADLRALADWDLRDAATLGEPCADPLLLVCTNGRRDVCCALAGRPLAAELAGEYPEQVWESSHLGGHRFAPAVLALPSGYSYGRMDAVTCRQVLAAEAVGRVVTARCRGRSTWQAAGQVAELHLRGLLGEYAEPAFLVTGVDSGPDGWQVRIRHRYGNEWVVEVRSEPLTPGRPVSCDDPAREVGALAVTAVHRCSGLLAA